MVKGEQNHWKTIDANGSCGKKPSYPIAPKKWPLFISNFHNLFQNTMICVFWGHACYDHFQTTDNSTSNDWKPWRKVTLLPPDFKWAHIEVIAVVFASVIEKDYRPQMTENHQGKWLSCYLTHKNMELSATTPQNPRDCVALGKLWI